MNSAEGNIADFFAEVVVMFDAEAQFTKLQDQLRSFSARIGAITIPVRLTGVNDASLEMAGMRDFGAPAGRRRSGGLTENQWESQTTRSMLAQGYKMGEGGWYKPAGEEVGAAAASSRGLGMLSGIGDTLGFAGPMAAFMGVFAAVGDLVKGAHYDQQLAVLRQLIPNQQQYAQALSTINEVANTAGTNILDTTHSFVTFTNAAQVAGVPFDQAAQSFKALTYAIAGTGSQSQAGRIFGDFSHMILNSSHVSMAQVQRSDLGRYLAIPQLLEQLPQFKGDDIKQLSTAFDNLTKSEQLTLINTVLLSRYQALAAASSDTLAGRWMVLENQLVQLGGVITDDLTPILKPLLDILALSASGWQLIFLELHLAALEMEKFAQAIGTIIGKFGQKSLTWLENEAPSKTPSIVSSAESLYSNYFPKLQFTHNFNHEIKHTIQNGKPSSTVKTSVKPTSNQASRVYARTK